MATEIAIAYVSLVPSFSGGRRAISRSLAGPIGKAGPQAGQSLGQGILRGVRAAAAAGGGIAAAIGIKRLGTAALTAATGLQDARATLSGLLGTAEGARDTIERLRGVARTSPIQFSTYLEAGNALAYMGIQGEQAEGILRNVGAAVTAAGGDDESIGRATDAMLQMVNSGRVYAAQLNQISDAGIPVFSGLASHFNTNIENVREMVSAGEVGIEDVMSVIENAEGDTFQSMIAASENATKTLSNQWKIAKDNIVTALGDQLMPAVAALTPLMTRFASVAPTLIESAVAGIGAAFAALSPYLSQASTIFQDQILPALTRIGAYIWSQVLPALFELGAALASAVMPLMESFGSVARALAPILAGMAVTLAQTLVPALNAMAGFIEDNQVLVGSFAAALAAAVLTMRIYHGAVLLINTATRAWAAVQRVLNTVMNANPILRIVTLIAALVAGLVYAWQNSETFRAVVTGAWEAIRNVVMAVVGAVVGAVTGAWNWIRDVTTSAWNAIVGVVTGVWDRISGIVRTVLNVIRTIVMAYFNVYKTIIMTAWRVVLAITEAVWGRIGGFVTTIWKIIAGVTKTFFTIIRALFQLGWLAIRKITEVVWNGIRKGLEVVWTVIRTIVMTYFNIYKTIIMTVWNVVRDITMAVWSRIRGFLRASFEFIRDYVINPIRTVMGWLTDRARNVRDNVVSAFRALRDGLRVVYEWIRDKVISPMIDRFQGLWDFIVKLKDGVVDTFSSVADTISGAFRGITDGIKSALNWVFGKINSWMISPINALLDAVGVDPIAELPKLHSGGLVPGKGERPYMLLGGEGVLNPQAVQSLGQENVDALNRGEPIGGFGLPDWLTEGLKHGVMLGAETATGQNLGDGLLAGLQKAVDAGLDKLSDLDWGPRVPREYSIEGTRRFADGLLDWARSGDEKLREDTAGKLHGSLPGGVGRPPGAGSNAGKVLPVGAYRIGRGPRAHGYNARDLPAPIGTPIYSAAAGFVSRALRMATSYGIHAGVNHGNWSSLYAHMSQMYVRAGQPVSKGQMIGRVGSTGNSTGPHLHLEPDLARLYDRGGYLPTGHSLVYNGTGQPERVLDPRETRAYEQSADSPLQVNVYGTIPEQVARIEHVLATNRAARKRPRGG